MKLFKISVLVLVAFVAFQLAWVFGPLSNLPDIIVINESYIETLEKQYLFVGFVTSLIVCAFALPMKIQWVNTVLVIGISLLSLLGHLMYAFTFSTQPVVDMYIRTRKWVESALGAFFCFAGLKLLTDRS